MSDHVDSTHFDPEPEPAAVLHGPWIGLDGRRYRIWEGSCAHSGAGVPRVEVFDDETPEFGWHHASATGEREGASELARLAAENRGLRAERNQLVPLVDVVNAAMELLGLPAGSIDEQFVDAVRTANRDARAAEGLGATVREQCEWIAQLRTLVVRQREVLGEVLGEDEERTAGLWGRIESLFANPDGQSASEWLEEEREKAAAPWAALYAELVESMAPGDCLRYALRSRSNPLKWLSDREAKAREEGRREGLRESARVVREQAEAVRRELLPLSAFNVCRDLAGELEALAEKGGD